MARGVPKKTIEERIALKESEIEKLTKTLADAKAELKKLKSEKQVSDNKKILDIIAQSGKSVDEIAEILGATPPSNNELSERTE